MRRVLAGVACLALLAGCSGQGPGQPEPTPTAHVTEPVPDDGVLLGDLGFRHAPEGVSIPRGAVVTERIDQTNNVTLVMTAPSGTELAGYLRGSLPDQGFEITADGNNSLLFTRGRWVGAFTTQDGYSALTLRTDRE